MTNRWLVASASSRSRLAAYASRSQAGSGSSRGGATRSTGGVGTGVAQVGVPPTADDHGLGQRLGQRHHALDEVRLGRRVCVEQHQHVAGARRHAEVADGGRPEPLVALAHQPHAGRDHRRLPGPVVRDHDLVGRARLTTQGRQGAVELGLLLVVGHDHRDRAPRRRGRGEVPAVAGHAGAVRRGGHPPTDAHQTR